MDKPVHCEECAALGRETYHTDEAVRMAAELDNLDDRFAPDGIVRWVLTERIAQEQRRAQGH